MGNSNNDYIKKINRLALKYDNQNNILNYNNLYELSKLCVDWLNSNIISFLLKDKIILFLEKNKIKEEIIEKIKKYNGNEIKLRKKILEIIKFNNLENSEEIIKLLNLEFDFNLLDFSYIKKTKSNDKNEKIKIYKFLYDNFNEINKDHIILFSHKYYINKISNNNLNLGNCDIYEENIILKNKDNIIKTKKINNTIKFRNYEKINLEKNNYIIKTIQHLINSIIDNHV